MITRILADYRGLVATLLAVVLVAPAAQAVPSFARQTGMACEACHTVFPELTHFGRMFKANAYTLDNLKQVRGVSCDQGGDALPGGLPPISLMVQVSQTSISKAIPDGTGNCLAEQHDRLSAADQSFLRGQDRAARGRVHPAHLRRTMPARSASTTPICARPTTSCCRTTRA